MTDRLNFHIEAHASGSRARAATFQTLHNVVQTPLFMPVGIQATVKAQLPQPLEAVGAQILLANTYHLLLRPGAEVFRRFGGIHRFMHWPKSVLPDSGGFQIFSLPHSRSTTEAGAVFQSYVDGRTILLSPERSIETQQAIGSDIMMALDQCVPSTVDEATARAALGVTYRWAARSLATRGDDSPHALFAIIQGALFPELRRESAGSLREMPFDGFAIGGLAVGEDRSQREEVCEYTTDLMPVDRPRYLMGVGTPLDILEAVHHGVDMFDCIIPTQVAKRGGAFTSRGYLQLRRGVYKFSEERVDPELQVPDLYALFPCLPASSDQDSGDFGLATARPAQPLLLPSANAREHPSRPVHGVLLDQTGKSVRGRPRLPGRRASGETRQSLSVGRLQGPRRAGRLCQHPADFLRRNHACAHSACGG